VVVLKQNIDSGVKEPEILRLKPENAKKLHYRKD
jgi:hypothetical protein